MFSALYHTYYSAHHLSSLPVVYAKSYDVRTTELLHKNTYVMGVSKVLLVLIGL